MRMRGLPSHGHGWVDICINVQVCSVYSMKWTTCHARLHNSLSLLGRNLCTSMWWPLSPVDQLAFVATPTSPVTPPQINIKRKKCWDKLKSAQTLKHNILPSHRALKSFACSSFLTKFDLYKQTRSVCLSLILVFVYFVILQRRTSTEIKTDLFKTWLWSHNAISTKLACMDLMYVWT